MTRTKKRLPQSVIDKWPEVFKDIDNDCARDASEPLATYVDVNVEDPTGLITVYNSLSPTDTKHLICVLNV